MLIAQRDLTLRDGSSIKKIVVRVFAPTEERPGVCGCRYEIGWPEGMCTATVRGVDMVQALVLALQVIAAEIYGSDYHKSGDLFWDAPGHGYGFPVAPTLRGLLVGDDKTYL